MVFKPGQSGNQNGRPSKGNTLTDILNAVFEKPREFEGRDPVDTKTLLAEYMRGAVTKGEVTLVTNEVLKFSPEVWVDLVKWCYNRMDGNPVQPIDGTQVTTLQFDAIGTVEKDYLPTPIELVEIKEPALKE